MSRLCPNCCWSPVANHPQDSCVLGIFVDILRERGNLSERKLRTLHTNCNVDVLWDRLGPILDDLEEGDFSTEEA